MGDHKPVAVPEQIVTLPSIGTYWTEGVLPTRSGPHEAFSTCARCGSFVNSPDRHEDWHRWVEMTTTPAETTDG